MSGLKTPGGVFLTLFFDKAARDSFRLGFRQAEELASLGN